MTSSHDYSRLVDFAFMSLDAFFATLYFPNWRDYVPLSNEILERNMPRMPISSQFPTLMSYSDFLSSSDRAFGFKSMFDFALTPTTSLGSVTSRDGAIALIILVLLLRRLKAFLIPRFCSIGRHMGRETHGKEWEAYNEERIVKFGEYVFRLAYHFSASVFGICFFLHQPWWDHINNGARLVFENYPRHEIDVATTWYYLFQAAYNVEAMMSLIELSFTFQLRSPVHIKTRSIQLPIQVSWSSNVRGDFTEMFVHHIITNLLVIGSSHMRFTRIGCMVFLVHDVSDIPVDLSKLANFLKWKVTSVLCFISLLIMWIFARLIVLPLYIVRSVFTDSHRALPFEEGGIHERHYNVMIPVFKLLLVGITSLHVFWFAILMRIFLKLLLKGERHDLSEHKHGEDQSTIPIGKNMKKKNM